MNRLHARIPSTEFKKDIWVNLCIDVFGFAKYCFKGIDVQTIDGINITSACSLRRIFTMRSPIQDSDFDTNPQLSKAFSVLAQNELGDASHNIIFEYITTFDLGNKSVIQNNQLIFPQRIEEKEN